MSENPIINEICRCCHSQGVFKSLSSPYSNDGREEIYSKMLKNTFNIMLTTIVQDNMETRSSICETCIIRLRDAVLFKEQVMACEQTLGRLYNRRTFKGIDICVVKEEHDNTSNGTKDESQTDIQDHIVHKYNDDTKITVKQELDITFHDIAEEDSQSNSLSFEYKNIDVKIEPVDTQEGNGQPLPVLKKLLTQGELAPHYTEDNVMSASGIENLNAIMKFHDEHNYYKSKSFIQSNQPKTAAERMREYRSRMRKNRPERNLNRPKTAAERMREYRARKRKNEIANSINQDEDLIDNADNLSNSELFSLSYVRRPKTVLERVREHRARKKNMVPSNPKTAKERVQEYRVRKKNLIQSTD